MRVSERIVIYHRWARSSARVRYAHSRLTTVIAARNRVTETTCIAEAMIPLIAYPHRDAPRGPRNAPSLVRFLNRSVSSPNTDTLGYKASGWFGYKTGEAIHTAARCDAPPP